MSRSPSTRILGGLAGAVLASAVLVGPVAAADAQTITFALPAYALGGSRPFPVALAGVASSGLAVQYTVLTPDTCSITGTTLTPLAAGTCQVTASQPGDATWSAAEPVTRTTQVLTTAIRVPLEQSFTVNGELRLSVPLVVKARTVVTMSVTTTEPLMAAKMMEVWARYSPTGRWTRVTYRQIDRTSLTASYRFFARPWAEYRWRWGGNGVLHDQWSGTRRVLGL